MDGKFLFMIPLVLLVSLTCHGADKTTSAPSEQVQKCSGCHQQMQLDPSHSRLACIDCHRGNNTLSDKDLAHKGLVAKPAAAGAMEKSCGKCHPNQVKQCVLSLHFTVKNVV